jgi:hypothetical protein
MIEKINPKYLFALFIICLIGEAFFFLGVYTGMKPHREFLSNKLENEINRVIKK